MKDDYALYTKLWQKSFLIEIVRKDTGLLQRTFAFSLPPESFSIEIPQRVNIKKTFGGHFIDDYGIDSMPITIKGSTGNGRYKEIYWDRGTTSVSGKSEAMLIVREIMQYKLGTEEYDKYELRLYDLSSIENAISGPMLSRMEDIDVLGWRVVLKSGKIERNKDKPFWYSYELNFVAIEPIGKKKTPVLVKQYGLTGIEKILAAVEKVKVVSNSLKKTLASYKSVIDKIKLVDEILENLEAEARLFYRTVQGFIDVTVDGLGTVFDIIQFPLDLVADLFTGVKDIRSSVESVFDTFYEGQTDLVKKAEEIAMLQQDVFSAEKWAAVITKETKALGSIPEVHVLPADYSIGTPAINPDTGEESEEISFILTYGEIEITATSETRLDVLAKKIYGSPDYADLIAKYNGITGDVDIEPGMKIKVPNINYTTTLRDSEIYSFTPDTYGTDISLSDNGDLVLAEYNDFGSTTGEGNISQAIVLRLSESLGARIRVPDYGIKNGGGAYDPFTIAVLVTSIRETLLQDPRIATVYRFTFQQDGDTISLHFDVELTSGQTSSYSISV